MGKLEFYNEFKELCDYYGNKIYDNKKITKMYYDKVKNLNLKEFQKMCRKFINDFKYMPKVAEFEIKKGASYGGYIGRTYTDEFLESLYDNA